MAEFQRGRASTNVEDRRSPLYGILASLMSSTAGPGVIGAGAAASDPGNLPAVPRLIPSNPPFQPASAMPGGMMRQMYDAVSGSPPMMPPGEMNVAPSAPRIGGGAGTSNLRGMAANDMLSAAPAPGADAGRGVAPRSGPSPTGFTMNDVDAARQFIASRTIHYRMGDTSPEARAAAYNLNPIAAVRSANMIAAAEAATGGTAIVTEAWRSDATQAVYYANRRGGPVEYNGVTYRPDTYQTDSGKTVTRKTNYPTARPGNSNHREGGALDYSRYGEAGKVRNWMAKNASQFGMRTIKGDDPHIEVNESTPLSGEEANYVVRELGYADVRDFQTKNGLDTDGIVGPQTTKAMLTAISAPSVEAAADPNAKPFTVYSSDIFKAEKEGKLSAVPPMSIAEAWNHVYADDPFGVADAKGAAQDALIAAQDAPQDFDATVESPPVPRFDRPAMAYLPEPTPGTQVGDRSMSQANARSGTQVGDRTMDQPTPAPRLGASPPPLTDADRQRILSDLEEFRRRDQQQTAPVAPAAPVGPPVAPARAPATNIMQAPPSDRPPAPRIGAEQAPLTDADRQRILNDLEEFRRRDQQNVAPAPAEPPAPAPAAPALPPPVHGTQVGDRTMDQPRATPQAPADPPPERAAPADDRPEANVPIPRLRSTAPPPAPAVNRRTIARGDKGPEVRKLQESLAAAMPGLPTDFVDGDYGPYTEGVVMALQERAAKSDPEVKVDGIVGDQTWPLVDAAMTSWVPNPNLRESAFGGAPDILGGTDRTGITRAPAASTVPRLSAAPAVNIMQAPALSTRATSARTGPPIRIGSSAKTVAGLPAMNDAAFPTRAFDDIHSSLFSGPTAISDVAQWAGASDPPSVQGRSPGRLSLDAMPGSFEAAFRPVAPASVSAPPPAPRLSTASPGAPATSGAPGQAPPAGGGVASVYSGGGPTGSPAVSSSGTGPGYGGGGTGPGPGSSGSGPGATAGAGSGGGATPPNYYDPSRGGMQTWNSTTQSYQTTGYGA